MEGWLYGLFTLLGVLAGGFFTYLGLRRQLEQQKEINEKEWKRKIRSEPLLKLRDELALMASKLSMLVIVTRSPHNPSNIASEESRKLQQAMNGWENYGVSEDFLRTLNLQYDAELSELVKQIRSDYLLILGYAEDYKILRPEQREEFWKLSQRIEAELPKDQELINKRLEEL